MDIKYMLACIFMSMGTAKQFLGLRERLEIEYIQVNTRFGDF